MTEAVASGGQLVVAQVHSDEVLEAHLHQHSQQVTIATGQVQHAGIAGHIVQLSSEYSIGSMALGVVPAAKHLTGLSRLRVKPVE